jgi:hypothetical protein
MSEERMVDGVGVGSLVGMRAADADPSSRAAMER